MKKVLILSLAYLPQVGGAEIAVKEITDRLPSAEYEFTMVTHRFDDSPRRERVGNVTVHRIGRGSSRLAKFRFQFSAASYALRLHRQRGFDGVWAIMAHSAGVPAALFTFVKPLPFLLTLQEGDPPEAVEKTMRPLWPLFARAFRRADRVQAISSFLADWARRRGARDVEVIPNGVDVAHFSTALSSEERDAARAALGAENDTVFLVTASRLVGKNALDDVIMALAKLPSRVHFIIYGDGPQRAYLETLAREAGVASRVRFMGAIEHARLPRALAACDIFVRPSRSEGMGNAFIEAMAAGLPVIGTQEGGIKDFLSDPARDAAMQPTGLAVDANSPAQIASAVLRILADPRGTADIVRNARSLAQTYDWGLIASRMRALFDQMLAKR